MENPLNKYREELARCSKCGVCMSVCPTYGATGNESMVARGRLGMLEAVIEDDLGLTSGLEERISSCAGCLACDSVCPGGVDIHGAILAARQLLASSRQSHGLMRAVAKHALGREDGPGAALRLLAGPGRALLGGLAARGFQAGSGPGTGAARMLPKLSPAALSAQLPEISRARAVSRRTSPSLSRAARSARRVAFFPGCATNLIYPETGVAAARLLNSAGFDVITPRGLKCCGSPFLSLGDREAAREMAEHNLGVLSSLKVDAIITTCSSCALTLKKVWPGLLGENRADVLDLTARALDIHQLLHELDFDEAFSRLSDEKSVRVTWHEPCHMRWGPGSSYEPAEIISRLPGVEYIEPGEEAGCCGGAAVFSLLHSDLSLKIGGRRAEEIAAGGVDVVVTACPGCRIQLAGILAARGLNIQVAHTADLLAGLL